MVMVFVAMVVGAFTVLMVVLVIMVSACLGLHVRDYRVFYENGVSGRDHDCTLNGHVSSQQ